MLLDGAHNAQGVAGLRDYVQTHLSDCRRVLLTGVLTEKLDDDMLHALAALGHEIVTVTPDSPRAMTGAELKDRFASVGHDAHACASLKEGVALAKALAGEDIVMKSAGSQLRSYCYVTDAACALLTVLLRGETGRAYNVANRESVHTIREYAETLARLAGVKVVFDLPPEAERQG